MKNKPLFLLKWLIPIAFAILGILLTNFIPDHGFLGFISICLAIIIACFYLIDLLKATDYMTEKWVRTVFTALLCLGLTLCAVTEAVILRSSLGDPDKSCQYIVVLGAKVKENGPSPTLQNRIDAAWRYLTAHPSTIAILSGGQGNDEHISEAQCMFDALTKKGIHPSRLWVEDHATSTWENIQFSLELIESKTGMRPKSIGILSSDYHLFRAGLFAREYNVETVGIPATTAKLHLRLNYFTREVAGVWHYLILGGHYYD